jgi:hypothetical protein
MIKTWKQKVGKRLMKHVKAQTSSSLLCEVKHNIEHQVAIDFYCFKCAQIAKRLNLPYSKATE